MSVYSNNSVNLAQQKSLSLLNTAKMGAEVEVSGIIVRTVRDETLPPQIY